MSENPQNIIENSQKYFFHPQNLFFLKISRTSWNQKMVTRNKPRHQKTVTRNKHRDQKMVTRNKPRDQKTVTRNKPRDQKTVTRNKRWHQKMVTRNKILYIATTQFMQFNAVSTGWVLEKYHTPPPPHV